MNETMKFNVQMKIIKLEEELSKSVILDEYDRGIIKGQLGVYEEWLKVLEQQ